MFLLATHDSGAVKVPVWRNLSRIIVKRPKSENNGKKVLKIV
jgi:hypothetical protein